MKEGAISVSTFQRPIIILVVGRQAKHVNKFQMFEMQKNKS